MPDSGFGIYVHWPFCQSKCPYCDFNSHVWSNIDQASWLETYLREIDRLAIETPDRVLRSVYFGGGTPSLMAGFVVDAILDRIRSRWRCENDIEITLEANPTSVESARFNEYRMAGVNRVSMGVQALNDTDLGKLGRLHSAREALNALDVARSVFERVSFDLIYARQDQSALDWQQELQQALSFDPSHLSLYQLTIEDGTAFGDRYARGGLTGLPTEDLGADLWDLTQNLCESEGLPAYEVSNHAKPGYESRHNLIYWSGGDYLGIGPGAHGRLTLAGQRIATEAVRSPASWLESVSSGLLKHEVREPLTSEEQLSERLLMGLRVWRGLDATELDLTRFDGKIAELESLGLVTYDGPTLTVTRSGRPVLNAVLRKLLES